ncbi:hypothetical protein [Shewanella gaetbuli]
MFFSMEYSVGVVEYFNSDELGYTLLQKENFNYTDYPFRALWHFLNDLIYITGGGYSFANKLLALPFVILIQLVTYIAFDRNKAFLLLMLACPYFIYIGTMDLRDTLIVLLCFSSLYAAVHKRYYVLLLSILLLIFLRPFAIILVLIPIILFVLLFRKKVSFSKKVGGLIFISIMSVCISVIFSSIIDSYIYRVEYLLTAENATSLKGEPMDLSPRGVLIYILTWVFTPLPSSLLDRLLESGGHAVFGLTDDLVRLLHQIIYFSCLTYVVVNFRYFISSLFIGYRFLSEEANKFYQLLLAFTLSWSFVYILFTLGAAHSRIKIVFTYFVVISAVCIFKEKAYNRIRYSISASKDNE